MRAKASITTRRRAQVSGAASMSSAQSARRRGRRASAVALSRRATASSQSSRRKQRRTRPAKWKRKHRRFTHASSLLRARNHCRLAGSKTSTDTALAPPTTATALSTSAAAEPFAAVAVAAAARPPRQGDDDDDDDAGSEGCFDSKVDSKHVCRASCSSCTSVITHPSFSEGDEVTCWAPTGSLREGKGPFQEYPYECGSHECIKIHE